MRKFVTLDCLIDKTSTVPSRLVVQSLRHAILAPVSYRVNIRDALHQVNFRFHRSCSLSNLIRECNVAEGQTLLIYWGCQSSESKATMSMSSCSSVQNLMQGNIQPGHPKEKEMRSIEQQTEISCRYSSVHITDSNERRLMRERPAAPPSPASPALQPISRSMSILSSVCALLLNKQSLQGSAVVVKEVSSVAGTPPSENICRICFGGESAERLVRPCSCRGTIAAVHRSCLERWLLQAATSYCELCRHHYLVTRTHKWSWMRSVVEWARSGRGRALVADACRGAALGAASVLVTARALHACDRVLQAGARSSGAAALLANLVSSVIIGVVGALNGLLTTWMLLKIQEHQSSWQAWRDGTLHVHVTLADEAAAAEAGARDSDATVVAEAAPPARPPAPPASPARPPAPPLAVDRSTNIADPFMVALPFCFADP